MLKKSTTLALAACLIAGSLPAQTFLPRNLTPEEIWKIQTDVPGQRPPSSGFTEPPSSPVRAMAEWEELQALVISWNGQSTILSEIVRAARLETNVIVCCANQATIDQAKATLISKGVDVSTNVTFLIAPNNSIWVRDYGPNSVYTNDVDSLLIVDWIYNRPRPLDDLLPEKVAQHLNLPLYTTTAPPFDMVHTGGNFMSDGMGMGFSSELVLDENGPNGSQNISNHSEAEVNDIMQQFMGIHTYPKMDPLPYDVIHHIDMHMKLLDEETLLVGKYPTGIADGPQIEANLQYILNNFKSSFGTPFKVVRIPMPPENGAYPHNGGDYRTYANAVFVNKTVILPTYAQQYDTTAIRIWQESLPGYNIVGINCNSIIPSLGAIHCITKEVGVTDPLRIVHQALRDVTDNNVPGYPVVATIQHRSGIASGKVHWATSPDGPWQILDMTSLSSQPNAWGAMIPVQAPGTTVYYFIEGTANSGKHGVRPMPAPAGWWKFKIPLSLSSKEPGTVRLDEIYPNPARAITCVPVFCDEKSVGSVRVYDVLGRMVETLYEGQIPAGPSNYFLNAANYSAGTYLVELAVNGTRSTRKLIVK
ncbi:MAG: agmatine deiminase family protein [Saprospiraceae bacterium]